MKPAINSQTRALDRLQNLLKDDDKLSGSLYAMKEADGTVNLYRTDAKDDTVVNRALHRFNAHSADARELVRTKIMDVLQQNGIDITADIRKALPSKTKLGNTAALHDAIANAKFQFDIAQKKTELMAHMPASANEIAIKLKSDLESMNWGSLKSVGTLFRGRTDGNQALSAYLMDQFKDVAKTCVSHVKRAASETLHKTGSMDKAMVAAHETLLISLKLVQFSTQFKEVVRETIKMVDTVAAEKMASGARHLAKAGETEGAKIDPQDLQTFAKALKEFIPAALVLRTLSQELVNNLEPVNRELQREAEALTGIKPPSAFSLTRMQNYVMAGVSGADKSITLGGTGKTDDRAAMPEYMKFLDDATRNNLDEFIAFNALKKEFMS